MRESIEAALDLADKAPQWQVHVPPVDKRRALDRARSQYRLIKGAQFLWVDDKPENNVNERRMFRQLDVDIDTVTDNHKALTATGDGGLRSRHLRHRSPRSDQRPGPDERLECSRFEHSDSLLYRKLPLGTRGPALCLRNHQPTGRIASPLSRHPLPKARRLIVFSTRVPNKGAFLFF
jgi:hypothetical protein